MIEAVLQAFFGIFRALVDGILQAFGLAVKRAVSPIEIRRAESVDELIGLRHRVLREGRPRASAHFSGDDKPTTRHWVAVQHDRVVGVVSVMAAVAPDVDDPPRWQLRGMAVEPELRGSGVGRALLDEVHREVRDSLWCNARAGVAGFYERSGWKVVSEPFDIPPIGPHVRMVNVSAA